MGDGPSYETVLVQNLFNGAPEDFGSFTFNLGTIEPGRIGKLSFGLKLPKEGLEVGPYRAIAQVFGQAKNGQNVSSNQAQSNFNIRFKLISEVIAYNPPLDLPGEVLGEVIISPECKKNNGLLPYVLLFLVSSGWLIEKNRNLFKEKKLYEEK